MKIGTKLVSSGIDNFYIFNLDFSFVVDGYLKKSYWRHCIAYRFVEIGAKNVKYSRYSTVLAVR